MRDGEDAFECPECDTMMHYEEGFMDCWGHNGHYTMALWFVACPGCDYEQEIEEELGL